MSDLEDLLTRELAEVGGSLHPPRVDTLGLRRVAARERRRRRASYVVAAAVVAVLVGAGAVLLPGLVGQRGVDPATAGGEDLGLAWVDTADVVHLASGRTVEVPGVTDLVTGGGTTVAVTPDGYVVLAADGSRSTVEALLDGATSGGPGLRPGPGASVPRPVVSADGRWLAWSWTSAAGGGVLARAEVGSGVTSTASWPEPVGATDVGYDGRVLAATAAGAPLVLWPTDATGEDPAELGGTDPPTSGVWLRSGDLVGYDDDQRTTLYRVGEAGVSAVRDLPGSPGTVFADDDSAYVAVQPGGLQVVTLGGALRPTSSVPLALPDGDWLPQGWAAGGAGDLVLVEDPTVDPTVGRRVARCDRDGACRVVDLPDLAYVAGS